MAQSIVIVPPKQWWMSPEYSPDGSKVSVQTPPPKIVESKGADGKMYKGQIDVPRHTVILNAKDFSQITTIDGQLWPTWSPDSQLMCANVIDRSNLGLDLALYNASNGKKLRTINAMPPSAFCWSPDSTRIFLTQREAVSVLDVQKKTEVLLPVKAGETYFADPQWSPDGKLIAASMLISSGGKKENVIRIWDAITKEFKSDINLKSHSGSLAWSPNGKYFIYSEPSLITILDAESKKLKASIETNEVKPVRFGWSNDKTKFYYSDGGNIHILDATEMKEILKISGPSNGFFSTAWTTDDKFILISAQNTAAICDAQSGKYLGHKTWPDSTHHYISPDRKLLIVQNLNDLTESEPIALPPAANASPFSGGKTGSPGWDSNASPKTIEECFSQFDKELTKKDRERFMTTPQERLGNFGGGSFITDGMMSNVYSKWGLFELKKYFKKRGITDPRDVTGIMLHSYWCYLNKKPIDLEDQIASHKAWWENSRSVIEVGKDLPDDILNFKLKNKQGGEYTIGQVRAKLKIITFAESDGYMSAEQLKCLKELRENHPSKDLAIIVCLVPPENLTKEHWPAIQTKVMGQGDQPSKDIAGFRSNCGDILVSPAPLALTEALFKLVKPTKYSQFGLPQTLVLTEPKQLKIRINHFDRRETPELLERMIKEAIPQ